jgi:beta-mannanase
LAGPPWDYTGTETQPAYQLADIIAGTYDSYITGWATAAAAWGKPCYLRFAHEMNGNWYPWAEAVNGNTAGQYATAWQHVRDIFTAAGATNVKWIWAPNVLYSGSTALAGLYPGDSYVDVVGVDGYNYQGRVRGSVRPGPRSRA